MPQLPYPHPEEWSWTSSEEKWQPRSCTLPEAARSTLETTDASAVELICLALYCAYVMGSVSDSSSCIAF